MGHKRSVWFVVLAASLLAAQAWAQQGKIISQSLDASGEGITVMKVWGTHHEMGYAQGNLLAKEIVKFLQEVKQLEGAQYVLLRPLVQATVWKPAELEQELDGMLAGIKAADPTAAIDKVDLKVVNIWGDWINPMACRSHSAWGSFVTGTTKTLSTRRLDYELPKEITQIRHHVLLAREPSDGSVRWVNLFWPGGVTAVTGVNEYGTLGSLHDYQSKFKWGAHMPRMVAVRHALTLVKGLPLDQHLDAVWNELTKYTMMTSTFINYYVPKGHGGVLTCMAGEKCSKKRSPQSDFHGGEVLITANTETDGHTCPSDGTFMDDYYNKGKPKTFADHYGLMGHSGMHLLSLDYRGRGDMTLYVEGRLSSGVTQTQKLEWSSLFSGAPSVQDSAAATADSGNGKDAGTSSGDNGSNGGDDDGCALGPSRTSMPSLALFGLALLVLGLRFRRRS
jgi:hypothetical protein